MIRILSGYPGYAEGALMDSAAEALRREGDIYIIVPRQLTLQTELTLIRALEPGGSFRLNVLSPERFCARVFDIAGAPAFESVDDRGRVMLARRALNEISDEMQVYSGAGHRRGFPARMARQLELLRQAGITSEDISELAREETGLFAAKLRDIARILSAYMEALSGGFLDEEGVLAAACDRCAEMARQDVAAVIFYGFDVAPRSIEQLMVSIGLHADTTVIFAADPDISASDSDIYRPVACAAARLRSAAAQAGAEVVAAAFKKVGAPRPADIERLTHSLFAEAQQPFEGAPSAIELMAMKDPRAEAMYVAAKCREMAKQGARWNDFMVVSPDIAAYARPLEDAFSAFDIPIFLSSSRPASRHSLAEALMSALRLIWKGFLPDDALALLRSGYSGVEDADTLAGYLLRYSPRGKYLTSPFVKGGEEAVQAEPHREKLIAPVAALREQLRAASGLRQQLTAIFDYLTAIGAYSRSLDRQSALSAAGLSQLAGEESQVWNRIISTLDQMALLMGDRRLSLEDLVETIREALDAAVIKPLPQSGDAVYAQSLDQAVMRRSRHLFVIGLTDRTYSGGDTVFTERQMEKISGQTRRYICADATEKALMRRYYIKTALASAQEGITFTYPVSGEDGSGQYPAMLLSEIRRIFPEMRVGGGLEDEELLYSLRFSAPGAALREATAHLDTDAGRRALAALAAGRSESVARLLSAFDHRHLSEQLSPDSARRLYGDMTGASVTRLEMFGKCPFAHFMRYAITPTRSEPFRRTARDEGSFFHDAVRAFITGGAGQADPETAQRRMDDISDALLERMEQAMLFDTAVSKSDKRRLKATARAAAAALVTQLAGSLFSPVEMELEFGKEDGAALRLETEDGECALEGRIDRIDEWRSPDEDFLRIIDYKRGNTELKLSDAYYGLQMQLIVYLAAAMRRRSDTGAGVYYFRIDDGIINTQITDEETVEKERRKNSFLKGLTLNEPEVVEAMSPGGDAISVRINKDGTISKTSVTADREAIDMLIARTLKNAATYMRRINSGEAAPSPVRTKAIDPCAYCDHFRACLFDPDLDSSRVRRVEEMTNREVLDRLRVELAARK